MSKHPMNLTTWAAACATALALAACGGGGDSVPPVTDSVPASASESTEGFMSYVKKLVASDADGLCPVDVSNVAPPGDEWSTPIAVD
jgi:hypothetical protein